MTSARDSYIDGFISGMCKAAQQDSTFGLGSVGSVLPWLMIPAAFWLGGNAGRYGDPDKTYLENMYGNVVKFGRKIVRPRQKPLYNLSNYISKDPRYK